MVQGRGDKKLNEVAAEQPRFMPLDGSSWEDSGYLPSDDDQSWREMEALRIGAYDRIGHLPPKDNQSWREQEALRPSTADESSETDNHADDTGNAEEADDPIAELAAPDPVVDPVSDLAADPIPEPNPDSYVPVRETIPEFQTARRGAGGVMLLLVSVVGLVTVALAVPNILTPDFWRTQWAAVAAKPAAVPEQRMASIPAPAPAVRPAILPAPPPPAPDNGPAVNAQPPASSPPNAEPAANAQPAANGEEPPAAAAASVTPEAAPSPRPDMRASTDRGAMVISPDGAVRYENGPAAASRTARRAAVPDERDAGGFYAMAPGPDGVMRRQFFPSTPEPGSRQAARAPSRGDIGGVYAMAPGPDGKLEYQFFPDRAR